MINIQQDTVDTVSFESILLKNGDIRIKLDINAIQSDIDRLCSIEEEKRVRHKERKELNETVEKLQRLIDKSRHSRILLTWSSDEDILKSSPVEIEYIQKYNIEMSDYIIPENDRLIRISYRNLYDIIALEIMYRDLGESMSSMEDKLSSLGITGIYPDTELLKYFDENIYTLSKKLKIGDSPYVSKDGRNSIEYFGKKKINSKFYNGIVSYSIRHAMSLITKALMAKLNGTNIEFKLCSISESGIYFLINNPNTVDIDEVVNESVIVRAFGRKFEVKPKIVVF